MNPKLNQFIERYTELEIEVQKLVTGLCNSLCAQCTQICCRADICEEAIESAFLRLIHRQTDLFSDRFGFLTETGCGLNKGRPPVCYEYFCDDQMYNQPDELHGQILRTLGALINHTGQNALNGIHLTDIQEETDLQNLDFDMLEKQFQESFNALDIIRDFFSTGTLPENHRIVLEKIRFAPEDEPGASSSD